MFPRMLIFALCLAITASETLGQDEENLSNVLESCTQATDCPANSFCARRGCDGMICMCEIGYQPSEDFTECLKVVELYRSCADEETRCRGPLAYCEHTTKTCRCMDGYIPATDNIRCKKMPRYGVAYAMLGENCEKNSVVCQDSNQQVCSPDTSTCTCREGLKPASGIDLNAEPFILDECRPEDFSLEVELEECKKPDIIGIALIGQKCNTGNNCPDNSKCKQIGCESKQCRCVNGTVPTRNMERCKPGVMLHQPCDDTVVCVGAYIACIRGKCQCSRGSVEAANNQCKSAPPIPGRIEFAALGEECNNRGDVMKLCESAMCTEGVCRCPPTMREMTPDEKLDHPNKLPPCIAIGESSEELSPAEYELRCVELPEEIADLSVLKRTGSKLGVTARWVEELPSTTYGIAEDNLEPSEVDFDESLTIEVDAPDTNYSSTLEPFEGDFNESLAIESSEPDTNSSVNLLGILMGSEGNDSLRADEIADRLFSLNESSSTELLNVSMGLNSSDASLNLNEDNELVALNDTFNFLLTNDFDAADFNESFDAEFLPDDLSFSNESVDTDSLNGTLSMSMLEANDSINLLENLMIGDGNNSLRADEIADRLFTLNDSVSSGLLNVSMSLNSDNTSLALDDDLDLTALNDTFNFLLENDFDGADFNESFDAEFLPEEEFDGNQTVEASEIDANNSLSLTDILMGIESNDSSELLDDSLGLNSDNSSLALDGDPDLSALNGTSNFSLSNDFDAMDFNESVDAEFLPDELNFFNDTDLWNDTSDILSTNGSFDADNSNSSFDMDFLDDSSLNSSISNSSLSNSSFDEMALNDSLDYDFFNSSSLDEGLDIASLNISDDEEISNSSLSGNFSDDFTVDDLPEFSGNSSNESLDQFFENFNQSSLNESFALDAINGSESTGNITDFEYVIDDSDLENENQTAEDTLNGSSSSFNSTEGFDMESLANDSSLNESLDFSTANGGLSTTTVKFDGMSSNEITGEQFLGDTLVPSSTANELGNTFDELATSTSAPWGTSGSSPSGEATATLSNEGGMEEVLQEESPDLGLSISDDGSHFVGSSGDGIEPVNYNNDADEDREKIDEIVEEQTFYNRILLEKCTAEDVCPPLSQCLDVGCGPPICFCLYSYGPSKDRKTCVQGAPPPVHCSDLETYEEIQPNQSSADTAPVAVATTLLCLGLILILAVIIIYLRLNL